MSLNINNNQYIVNKPSFCGQRLFPVTLLKTFNNDTHVNISAFFTKMADEDTAMVADVCDMWYDTKYGELICKNFLRNKKGYRFSNNYDYFMIETNSPHPSGQKVKAIAEVKYDADVIELNFLQSKSELPTLENIKGAGTMLLYGLCKYAKQIRAKGIELYSDNTKTDNWYKKLGFKEQGSSLFVLNRQSFNKFLKNIENKFLSEN